MNWLQMAGIAPFLSTSGVAGGDAKRRTEPTVFLWYPSAVGHSARTEPAGGDKRRGVPAAQPVLFETTK